MSRKSLHLKATKAPVLQDISISLEQKELLVVIGKIGAGKTSLLLSIMNETLRLKGEHRVHGKIALVEQDPFIFSGTIKQNICFGLEYAECRFRKAVQAA